MSPHRVTVTGMSERNPRAAWLVPIEEMQRRARQLPQPVDVPPLDEQARQELRERLNRIGGRNIALKPREFSAWYAMTVVRPPERVADLVVKVQAESRRSRPGGRQYASGILDAVAWATGQRREAPITGTAPEGPLPTVGEMTREAEAGREVARRERESIHPQEYAVGVEACLMWLNAEYHDDPPW